MSLPKAPSYRVADLPARKPTRFDIALDPEALAALAADLGILGVKRLGFRGELRPSGRNDWDLAGDLSACVVQACVVTLEPVETDVTEAVVRRYVADYVEPEGEEIEMPEDDSIEPLPAVIDLGEVIAETVALALPPYPRSANADAALPEDSPREKPFANLADLLARKGETPSS